MLLYVHISERSKVAFDIAMRCGYVGLHGQLKFTIYTEVLYSNSLVRFCYIEATLPSRCKLSVCSCAKCNYCLLKNIEAIATCTPEF